MAANKFATKLQRNTNKITVILTYAVLEWTLIFLLLLNSMFSFLIIKFADYFGLKPPCFLCSQSTKNDLQRDLLLCESHCRLVSRLGFCETHHRLLESKSTCVDCSVSNDDDDEDDDQCCCCCGVRFEDRVEKGEICDGFEVNCSERLMKDEGVQVDDVLPHQQQQQHLEFFVDCSGQGLVPIELIQLNDDDDDDDDDEDKNNQSFGEIKDDQQKFAVGLESMEIEEDENSLVFYAKDCFSEFQQSVQEHQEKDSDAPPAVSEDYSQMQTNEAEHEAEVSIGTEIPDLDIADDFHCSNQAQDHVSDLGCRKQDEEQTIELRSLFSIEIEEEKLGDGDHGCRKQDEEQTIEFGSLLRADSSNEIEEERVAEKKDWASEGSVEELDCSDPISTIERLKSALRSERKALSVLYTELEEERSASAVAANETMAMINRLQEEKAAMQMEALQYQRMMDEQSEYDQEALQLLNELMVKREKERQELEKELQVYRKRVLEYEAKERAGALMVRRSKEGFSSSSYSEESDGLSIDLNQEAREEDDNSNKEEDDRTFFNNTPADDVVNLEDSLADFEEERMAILEQLKALEEKLMTMDDEEVVEMEDLKGESNGHYSNGHHHNHHHVNGYSKKMLSSMGKSLLPLFDDAMSVENGENGVVESHPHENGFYSNGDCDSHHKRDALEEELDCLHERLQALEADREFLKHCIGSLKKGDKGMDLLQEILQHLRDLRNVDLRVKGLSDGPLV